MLGKTNVKVKPNEKKSLIDYVEYIESTGTQYIDTGIKDYSKVVLDFTPLTETATCVYFGAQGTGSIPISPISLWRYFSSSKFLIILGKSTQQKELSININENYLLETTANAGTLTTVLNGTASTYNYSTTPATTLIAYLFALNNNGTTSNFSHMRCRSAKFYSSDGTLLRDFRPVKDGAGVYCMYDEVEKRYYYNQGTGDFTGGASI